MPICALIATNLFGQSPIEVLQPPVAQETVIELVSDEQTVQPSVVHEQPTAQLVIDLDATVPDISSAFPDPEAESIPAPKLFPNQSSERANPNGAVEFNHAGPPGGPPLEGGNYQGPGCDDCGYQEDPYWFCQWLGNRHSSTHGRSIGPGGPLRGTSWLNRPYSVGLDFGGLIMTGNPAVNVTPGNDFMAAIHGGWDWDHYWGGQLRVAWSTPRIDNTAIAGDDHSDNLFITDVSVVHYPWGDSRFRPYVRLGMGLTDLEFTNTAGNRQHELLYTIPMAIGVKYQFRRWMAWRAEFANNLALGQNGSGTLNNLSLTIGFERRFGGRPSGYWAWQPRGHSW